MFSFGLFNVYLFKGQEVFFFLLYFGYRYKGWFKYWGIRERYILEKEIVAVFLVYVRRVGVFFMGFQGRQEAADGKVCFWRSFEGVEFCRVRVRQVDVIWKFILRVVNLQVRVLCCSKCFGLKKGYIFQGSGNKVRFFRLWGDLVI